MNRSLVSVALLLGVSCMAQAQQPVKDTITVGFATESTTLDPSRAAAGADYYFIGQMFEQLVRRGPDGSRVNWLAESYSVDRNNGKPIIDVRLRQDVKFHNGDPLTAEDFEFSFNRQRDPKISRIAHLQAAVERFEIVDPYHFRLHFSEGDATYDTDSLRLWALPKKYFQQVGDEGFAARPVGTGPWKLVARNVKTDIRFELFDKYWNKQHQPTVKYLHVKIIPEDLTRVAALKTGAVDLIESVPVAAVEELRKTPGIKTVTLNTTNNLFVQLATHVPGTPWHDVRVRRAAAHAIDMDAIIKNVLFGQGERYAQLSPDDFGYDPAQKPYGFDPKKSRQLLAEAGFPRGFDTPCYNFTTQREPNLKEVGEAIFAYFGAVGIRCKPLQGVEYNAWLNLIRRWPEGSTQKVMDGAASSMYGHGGNDVSNAWAATLHTFEPARGFGSSSNTSIPELDKMIEEQKREMDPEKRIILIRKIAEIKHDQVLAGITTYRPLITLAWRDNVHFVPWAMPAYWRGMQEIGFKATQ
jgi:peptide/nickel transport system substrate-binding protein